MEPELILSLAIEIAIRQRADRFGVES